MSSKPICDRVNTYANRTIGIPGYEGIPHNLLINVVGWVVLMFGFSLLRKLAWDYGRMAMVQPKKNRWTTLFYADVQRRVSETGSVESLEQNIPMNDPGYFSWIISYFKLTSDDLQSKAGSDAVQYLRFHTYLIIYTAITTVLCLVVILPVNIHGTLKSPDLQQFGVTTISNISSNSSSLWVHTIFAIGFFLLAFFLMQHFSRQFRRESNRTLNFSDKTLMIWGISRTNISRALILRHFAELYPDCPVEDVQICYDIRKLIKLENERDSLRTALKYSIESYEQKGRRPLIIPRCCGWMCKKCYKNNFCRDCCWRETYTEQSPEFAYPSDDSPIPWSETADTTSIHNSNNNKYNRTIALTNSCSCCCACTPAVDAIDYYESRNHYIQEEIDKEYDIAFKTPIGIAFVTFSTRYAAARVCKDYRDTCKRLMNRLTSSVSKELRSHTWSVDFAPTPSNIIWGNLSVTRTVWWCRAIIINLCVFFVVFFLTTPTYVLNLVNTLHLTERLQINNPLLNQFIPSIILWSVSALLPYIVFNSDRIVGHWTKSCLHLTVMTKTFTLLILMILILPSLGLTSIPALLQWLFPEMRIIPLVPSNDDNTTVVESTTTSTTFTTTTTATTTIAAMNTSSTTTTTTSTTTTTPSSLEIENTTSPFIPLGPQSFQWECVFMPDNGAFFVNYVITAAFIGTALELVRFSELINYACRLMCVKSGAEKGGVRKASQFEFEFGLFYAWSLCVFAVICAYSILCPLITPFGLIYLIMKYFVERYNLYYAYLPSRIDSHIHWLAISCMLASVFLLQLNIFMFIVLRADTVSHALVLCSLLGLIFSALLLIFTIITGWVLAGNTSARKYLLRHANHIPVNEDVFDDQQSQFTRSSSLNSKKQFKNHMPNTMDDQNSITDHNDASIRVGVHTFDQITSRLDAELQQQQQQPTNIDLTSGPSSMQILSRQDLRRNSCLERSYFNVDNELLVNPQFVAPVLLNIHQRVTASRRPSAFSVTSCVHENHPDNQVDLGGDHNLQRG
ncbi:unnamed protein product [Trichobilharzia szidati]|nr:unnamed protein product [Trichobilharzia szidati]